MSLARVLRLPGTQARRGAPRRTLVLACYVLALLGASYYLLHPSFSSAPSPPAQQQQPPAAWPPHDPGPAHAGGSGGRAPARKKRPRPDAPKPVVKRPASGFPQHVYRKDGLVGVNPEGRHPIYDLIERAEAEWEGKLSRASKSLDEAVAEYRKRHGRNPPKGFDRW